MRVEPDGAESGRPGVESGGGPPVSHGVGRRYITLRLVTKQPVCAAVKELSSARIRSDRARPRGWRRSSGKTRLRGAGEIRTTAESVCRGTAAVIVGERPPAVGLFARARVLAYETSDFESRFCVF